MTSKLVSFSKSWDTALPESFKPDSDNLKLFRNDLRHRYRLKQKVKYVTICIAGICEGGSGNPQIVFAADRLATDQNGFTFELGISKIERLCDNYFIMNAGNASRASMIIQRARSQIIADMKTKKRDLTGLEISEILSKNYREVQDEVIQKFIFDKKGMKREEFYSKMKSLPTWFSVLTHSEVQNFDFGVELLLIGFDITNQEQGRFYIKIYGISENGEIRPEDSGFSMIGIGYSQSVSEITKEPYDQSLKREAALLKVYYSKKAAQRMIGVGEKTDLGFLTLGRNQENTKWIALDYYVLDAIKQKLDDRLKDRDNKLHLIDTEIKNAMEKGFTETLEVKNLEEKVELKDTVEVKKIEKEEQK